MNRSRLSAAAAPLLRTVGSNVRLPPVFPPATANGSTAVLPLRQHLHATAIPLRPEANNGGEEPPAPEPDALAESGAKGRTGGGEKLSSSSANAPAQPKISNMSVPGGSQEKLTEEQQREVDRHNKEFEEKHDRGETAPDDKVDKGFWQGRG